MAQKSNEPKKMGRPKKVVDETKKLGRPQKTKEEKLKTKIANHKKKLIKAMEECLGIVTDACKKAKINRTSYYKYYNEDEDFRKSIDDIQEIIFDFVESKNYENIRLGRERSIINWLDKKGRKRGYITKIDNDINIVNKEIIFEFGDNSVENNDEDEADD